MEEKKRERFTAFITKYALTRGIIEATVDSCFHISPDMVHEVDNRSIYYHGKDWHRTRQAALARVLEMIATKRKSLANSHRKLDALESHIRDEALHLGAQEGSEDQPKSSPLQYLEHERERYSYDPKNSVSEVELGSSDDDVYVEAEETQS